MAEKTLEVATPNSVFKADNKLHQQERDVAKFWKNGEIKISLLGFENQTQQDYKMPLRVISYDGASYKQQLLDDKSFDTVYNNNERIRNGGVTMCEVVQRIIDKGRTEGRQEDIRNLLEAKAGTVEQIATWLKLPLETVKEIAQKMPVQA